MWNSAHLSLTTQENVIHHHGWTDLYRLSPEKVQKVIDYWKNWWNEYGNMPPGLITESGILIDGNHRYKALCELNIDYDWWCTEVEYRNLCWLATAKPVLIEVRKSNDSNH